LKAAISERKLSAMVRDRFAGGLVWLVIIGFVVVFVALYKLPELVMALQSPMAGPILFVAFLALVGGAFIYRSKR
jgi:hypothetical protein